MARSRGLLNVPKYYKGSKPNSHWTELIYATKPEIEKLRELDMHKSGIGKEDHYGPGGLLNMNEGDTLEDIYGGKGKVPKSVSKRISGAGSIAKGKGGLTPKKRVGRPPPFSVKKEASVYAGPGYATSPVEPLKNVPDWRKDVFPDRGKDKPPKLSVEPWVPRTTEPSTDEEDNGTEPEEETETETEEEEDNGTETETETETETGDTGAGPSLATITKPDQTPSLRELTSDMDLRNMLGNVLNQNNPLFKQARTRAYQAMRARGMPIDSSMTNDLVMENILKVAMPIATRVIDDLQRVMKERADASDAFKMAMNNAYYQELLVRVDAANKWNLQRMLESGLNWREMLAAKSKGADAATAPVFERYMDMISKNTGGATGLSGFETV